MNPSGYPEAAADRRGLMTAAHFTKLEALMSEAALEAALAAEASARAAADGALAASIAAIHSPVTLGALGTTPNANGASLTGQALTLQPASATLPGVVTAGAQEFGGAKTLTGAILAGVTTITEAVVALVRAVGVSLVLRSSLGAGATDKCVVVGSSTDDGSVNAATTLLVAATGIGGTQVDKFAVTKSGGYWLGVVNFANINLGSAGSVTAGWYYFGLGPRVYGTVSAAAGKATIFGTSTTDATGVNATTRLAAFATGIGGGSEAEKSAAMASGDFESFVTGAGIVLKSPDGTRYRLTVANGGTLSIAAA